MSTATRPPAARERIDDELDLMRRVLTLDGARVVDLGCGNAAMDLRLLEQGLVASVDGLEVDEVQHRRNLQQPARVDLSFHLAGADDIPMADASFDLALMFKSLHHVPLHRMDRALAEIARVLVPGGTLYVSEPVFDGEFNEIVRLFHDEQRVRAEALAALHRCAAAGTLQWVDEIHFDTPLVFRDYDDFVRRIVKVTHTQHDLAPSLEAEVRRRFEAHLGPDGAHFVRPMRVNLLRRP